jgi:hypothetical protein
MFLESHACLAMERSERAVRAYDYIFLISIGSQRRSMRQSISSTAAGPSQIHL